MGFRLRPRLAQSSRARHGLGFLPSTGFLPASVLDSINMAQPAASFAPRRILIDSSLPMSASYSRRITL